MYVSEILQNKGDKVISVRPDEKILEAARILNSEKIGAAVVTELKGGKKPRLVGIISERDILNSIARNGELALHRTVKEVMTSRVIACGASDQIDDLLHEMTVRRIRHLPVMDGDELKGMISIGDLVKNRLGELETETGMLQQYIAS